VCKCLVVICILYFIFIVAENTCRVLYFENVQVDVLCTFLKLICGVICACFVRSGIVDSAYVHSRVCT